MIGIRTQSWDRRKHGPPDELVPQVHCVLEMEIHGGKELLMSQTGIRGIDLFKIAGESISGWILKGNRGTPIRNESEPSSKYFLAESSDKDI